MCATDYKVSEDLWFGGFLIPTGIPNGTVPRFFDSKTPTQKLNLFVLKNLKPEPESCLICKRTEMNPEPVLLVSI